ncbi:hypothetical protein Ahy_A09g042491 [Arachis hypogaea]|uniref:Uncharacterized protein n=1 Tax=Arachis hypogaea TaxID=3818 RepID=A0A445BG44_ARAHY|nr:hypothetical protein Ahy_A09g042491 [Arachis hypogaea]
MKGNQNLCGAKFLRPCREGNNHVLSKKSIATMRIKNQIACQYWLSKDSVTGLFRTDIIIGANSLRTVYKGQLEQGQIVAIKRLDLHQSYANTNKIFKTKANTLSQLITILSC